MGSSLYEVVESTSEIRAALARHFETDEPLTVHLRVGDALVPVSGRPFNFRRQMREGLAICHVVDYERIDGVGRVSLNVPIGGGGATTASVYVSQLW